MPIFDLNAIYLSFFHKTERRIECAGNEIPFPRVIRRDYIMTKEGQDWFEEVGIDCKLVEERRQYSFRRIPDREWVDSEICIFMLVFQSEDDAALFALRWL